MSLPVKTSFNNHLVIIGAGAWGSALSIALSSNFKQIYLICKNKKQVTILGNKHPNLDESYNENILLTSDYSYLNNAENILIATPSYAFLDVLIKIKPYLAKQNIAWATKGFSDNKLLHQTFSELFSQLNPCLISGPSFAKEMASLKPTALAIASTHQKTAIIWANMIKSKHIRTYISGDIIGCEIGGAVKNILAIAAGISVGLGYGTNTMSALITRGLAEMMRLGVSIGGQTKTFMGLTGLGDLTLTCFDDLSRNRRFGKEIAKNNNIKLALKTVGATVEGLNALPVVLKLAKKKHIQMPICESIEKIITGKITAKTAVIQLMNRDFCINTDD